MDIRIDRKRAVKFIVEYGPKRDVDKWKERRFSLPWEALRFCVSQKAAGDAVICHAQNEDGDQITLVVGFVAVFSGKGYALGEFKPEPELTQ